MSEISYGFVRGRKGQPTPESPGAVGPPRTMESFKPEQVKAELAAFKAAHKSSDVDFAPQSLHHTIGSGPMQAGSGADLARVLDTRPLYDEDDTDLNVSGTSYVNGSPVCGFSFQAPPSGQGLVLCQARMESNNNTIRGYCSWQIRDGSTLGSGTVIYNSTQAEADNIAVVAGDNVTVGGFSHTHANVVLPVVLTAGSTYNLTTIHRATGSTIDIFRRIIMFFPWI